MNRSLVTESPLTKERILGMLPMMTGLLEEWSDYSAEENEGVLDHYIASANYLVRVSVQGESADFVIIRRGQTPVIAFRRFGWGHEQFDGRFTALIPVDAEEMLGLERKCGATQRMSVKKAFGLWLKLNALSRTGKRDELFGSSGEIGDVFGPVCATRRVDGRARCN